MLSPSDKVSTYELIAPLGKGGMAQLYLARRHGAGGFSRLVTLKFVHDHLRTNEDIVQLFLQEARLSAHITHPNVVRVEDVGRFGDSYFIAMEYVHGVSLAELLDCMRAMQLSRLAPALYIWIAAQIAEALHAAHEARSDTGAPLGIVHHDVSPENVLVSDTGHVKLIDFGIARSWAAEPEETSDNAAVRGKLRYMAPEQLMRERADRRADVYALGVVLWEMLTGRTLLRCRCLDDARDRATRANPPPPSRYRAGISSALDQAVLKAIACEPDERHQDALQFRAALLAADPEVACLDAPSIAKLLAPVLKKALQRARAEGSVRWANAQAERGGVFAHAASSGEPTRSLDGLAMGRARTEPAYTSMGTLGWPYTDALGRHTGAR